MTFDGEHLDAIREYWTVFRDYAVAALTDVALRAQRLPGATIVTSQVTPEQDHALLDDAVLHGAWEPYLSSLRARGTAFAIEQVDYETWTEVLRMERDEILVRLVPLVDDNPTPLPKPSIVAGMTALVDLRTKTIGSAFFVAKRQLHLRSEAQYEALFQASPLPMFTYAVDGLRITDANEAMLSLVRSSRSELVGGTFERLCVSEAPPDVPTGHGFVPAILRQLKRSDGEILRVELSANDVVIGDRALRIVSLTDVTERERARDMLKRTEAQLHHAQKMDALGRLAGGIAHDFNNILTVVGSYACMLEESLDNDDARRFDASEIRLAAERATQLTRRLLALGRNTAAAPKAMNLDHVIAEFRPMLTRLVGERVTIDVIAGHVPPIFADAGQIEQVLMNLAVNARDAIGGTGRLTIETSTTQLVADAASEHGLAPGLYVVLTVTDTGVGIEQEVQAKIFDPFFTTKDATQGTGLGLSIVHGIITQAQGSISVFSKPTHGTTFRIHLPATNTTPVTHQTTIAPAPIRLPPLCVLVVDDQRDLRAATMRILTDAGCTVLEAANAADARRICVSHDGTIHVAVIDVVLSDGRGDLLADELRALRSDLHILLTSGYPAATLGTSADAGLLAKPFRPAQLREALAQLTTDVAPTRRSDPALQPRVLLVDDDADVRKMLVRVLRRAAFEVTDVDSGRRALAELEARRFDVVISDVHMPDGDGLDVVRGVRRLDLDIPVILISGKPDVHSAATALEYGAFRYLTKPIDIEPFERVVRQATRARALARIRRQASTINGARVGASDRAGLEVRFEHALANLWMAFQPIYDARTNALYGVEALMRSREPSIPHPGALLDTASTLGRLPLLGRRVRHLAASALASRPDISALFVNLHPADLADIDLINADTALSQIAPRVILEVTERESLVSSIALTDRLARLRELGFRLAVDDIGAGYSGLTSFADLTPEIVKIDMSLVRAVHTSTLKQHTIRALCSLCHEVGTLVVGEGVETTDERDCLISLGCDLLQGYLLGRPSPDLPT